MTEWLDAQIRLADWRQPADVQMLLRLLADYALHPMGGGKPLAGETIGRLPERLAAWPGAFSLLATHGGRAVGLANCLPSFSTFAAAPRVNLHDLYVCETARGRGLGRQLLAAVRAEAVQRGAVAVTLEVRADNLAARRLYSDFGFQGIPAANHSGRTDPAGVYYFAQLPLTAA